MRGSEATEHQEQAALYEWRDATVARHPDLAWMFAIPNGGARHPAVAMKLKREGVQAGVLDNFLAVPRRDYHGLWIEMKRRSGGEVSDEQKRWMLHLHKNNYGVVVARGWEEAAWMILEYLAL